MVWKLFLCFFLENHTLYAWDILFWQNFGHLRRKFGNFLAKIDCFESFWTITSKHSYESSLFLVWNFFEFWLFPGTQSYCVFQIIIIIYQIIIIFQINIEIEGWLFSFDISGFCYEQVLQRRRRRRKKKSIKKSIKKSKKKSLRKSWSCYNINKKANELPQPPQS